MPQSNLISAHSERAIEAFLRCKGVSERRVVTQLVSNWPHYFDPISRGGGGKEEGRKEGRSRERELEVE